MVIQYDFEHIFGKKFGQFGNFFAGFDIDFGKRREGDYTHVNHAPEDRYMMIYESRCAFVEAVHCNQDDTIRRG